MARAGLVVVKVGSSTLVDSLGKPDLAYMQNLVDQIAELHRMDWDVVLVSSGAAAAGRERLGFSSRPSDPITNQACVAAGQAALTEIYAKLLSERSISCGQVLLTRRDVLARDGYLNARNTFERLLELGVVPVVNENDTVISASDKNFGGNDLLGAIVASLLSADLYIILSDVDGLYTANPSTHPEAQLLAHVAKIDRHITQMAGGVGSSFGTGGMGTKLLAARALLATGIPSVIAQGRIERVVPRIVRGESLGTRFEDPASNRNESSLKLWIGMVEVTKGTLMLDDGAQRAVCEQGASILPVGIIKTMGRYDAGDVVDVVSKDGELIGRGVARYNSTMMHRVRGLKLDIIARFLDKSEVQPAVHRDELLIF